MTELCFWHCIVPVCDYSTACTDCYPHPLLVVHYEQIERLKKQGLGFLIFFLMSSLPVETDGCVIFKTYEQ